MDNGYKTFPKNPVFASTKTGDVISGNYTEVEPDGTIVSKGDGTVWDEVSSALIAQRLDIGTGRIAYNYNDLTVDFADNARYPDEVAPAVIQSPHSWKSGGGVRPHIHWIQNSADVPNMLVAYRDYDNGGVPGAYTLKALTASDSVFTYPGSGSILQITNLNIDPSFFSSMGLSFTFDCKIYRDTNNASGLFSGADSYTGAWGVKYYDIHFEKDMIGSRQEFVK